MPHAVIGLPEWARFVAAVDDMIESGAYDWALARLNRIADTVEQTRRVTEDQRAAVATIHAGQGTGRA